MASTSHPPVYIKKRTISCFRFVTYITNFVLFILWLVCLEEDFLKWPAESFSRFH